MHVHEPWHLIALEDLNSAKHLFLQSFMTTLFHVQQCAEKVLKSYINTSDILNHVTREITP